MSGPVFPFRNQDELTPREREVLALLLEGLSTSQMAEKLGVEGTAVQKYVSHILDKTGQPNRKAVVARLKLG